MIATPILTRREREVLQAIASGMSSREAAACLYVTSKDIDYHVEHLFQKLGCRTRHGLVGRVYAFGYLRPGEWPPVAVSTPRSRRSVGSEPARG